MIIAVSCGIQCWQSVPFENSFSFVTDTYDYSLIRFVGNRFINNIVHDNPVRGMCLFYFEVCTGFTVRVYCHNAEYTNCSFSFRVQRSVSYGNVVIRNGGSSAGSNFRFNNDYSVLLLVLLLPML
jgi:hypothetical protein